MINDEKKREEVFVWKKGDIEIKKKSEKDASTDNDNRSR